MVDKISQDILSENDINSIDGAYKQLKERATNHLMQKDKKFRRNTYKDLDVKDQDKLEKLAKLAPESAQDPEEIQDSKGSESRIKNTGVYLWAKGYDVQKFLGAGGFGVVWQCASKSGSRGMKAIKVLTGDKYDRLEENGSAKQLNEILEGDKTGKAEKYLARISAKSPDGENTIFRSEVADGSLLNIESKKAQEREEKCDEKLLKIDSVLKKARQALKSVKFLHDAGYSHNDIKTENFLRQDRTKIVTDKK